MDVEVRRSLRFEVYLESELNLPLVVGPAEILRSCRWSPMRNAHTHKPLHVMLGCH